MNRYVFAERVVAPLTFIGPGFAFLGAFIVFPIGYSIYISFHDYFLGSRRLPSWIGLENFRIILGEPVFWGSVRVTLIFCVGVVILTLIVSFALALLYGSLRGQRIFLTLLILPITIPPIVVGLMFKIFFYQEYGIADYLTKLLGIAPPAWLSDPATALATLVLIGVWEHIPLSLLILMAGLKSIPDEMIEAAMIDGASAIQRLFFVIIPMMKPVVAAVLIITTIDSIKQFDISYSLTSGGPGTSTLTMTYYANNMGFEILQIGRAAAASVIVFVTIIVSVALISATFLRGRGDEQ
jgi:multiple sugar transport system permease protein